MRDSNVPIPSRSKLLPFYQRKLTGIIVFLFSLLLTTGSLHADFDPGSVQLAQAQPPAQLTTPEVTRPPIGKESVFVTFSWRPITNAVGYQYRLYNDDGLFDRGRTTTVSKTYPLNRLPYSIYRLEVIALAPEGSLAYSNSNAGVYMDDFPSGRFPVVTRSEFVLSPVTTDSITLMIIDYPEAFKSAYEPGVSVHPEYHINLELDGIRQGREYVEREGSPSFPAGTAIFPKPIIIMYENLMPDTNYEIVLILSTGIRSSEPKRFPVRTLALPRLPRPAGLTVEVGATTAVLTWSESAAANASTYQISLDGQIQGEVPVADEVYNLMGLDASMESCLRIVARAPGFLDSPTRGYRLKDGMASVGCGLELRLRAFLEGPLQ